MNSADRDIQLPRSILDCQIKFLFHALIIAQEAIKNNSYFY